MKFLAFLFALGLAIVSLVSSFPLEGHKDYHHHHHVNHTSVVYHHNSSTIEHHPNPGVQKSTATSHNITKRSQDEPPTVAEVMVWITETKGWNGDGGVFYTYPGSVDDAVHYARGIGGMDFRTLFTDGDTLMEYEWCKEDESNIDDVFDIMSEAFAEVCKSDGPVFLMLPKDATPTSDSTWVQVEAPVLGRRGITVKAVDPSTDEVWNDDYLKD